MTIVSLQSQFLTRTNIHNTMTLKMDEENHLPIQSADTHEAEGDANSWSFNSGLKLLARVTLTFILVLVKTAIVYVDWRVERAH